MEGHLKVCSLEQTSTSAAAQSKPSLQDPSLCAATQDSSLPSPQPSSSDVSFPLLPPTTISPSVDLTAPSTVHSSAGPKSKLEKVKCPLCTVTCYKRNMDKHIQRKHPKKSKDVTETDHLKSVCADAKNGISAVQRGVHGFSVM